MLKYLNNVPLSDDWFPYEHIDDEVKQKLDETKRQLAGNEMKNDTKHYVEYLNHDPNWLMTITLEFDKFLINQGYIEFFLQMYIQWRKVDGYDSSSQTLIIPRLPSFEKLALSQFQLYIKTQTMTECFVCCYLQNTIIIRSAEVKERVLVFYTCSGSILVCKI